VGAPMKAKTTSKCLKCSEQYVPDHRNRRTQCYCAKAECRKESKAESQKRWLGKPENQNYFRGAGNTDRTRQWRKANRGYRRKKKSSGKSVQQDLFDTQEVGAVDVVGLGHEDVQQDLYTMQPALLVGIIAIMTGHVQQEDIAASVRSFLARGADILRMGPGSPQIPKHENQTNPVPAATAARTAPI